MMSSWATWAWRRGASGDWIPGSPLIRAQGRVESHQSVDHSAGGDAGWSNGVHAARPRLAVKVTNALLPLLAASTRNAPGKAPVAEDVELLVGTDAAAWHVAPVVLDHWRLTWLFPEPTSTLDYVKQGLLTAHLDFLGLHAERASFPVGLQASQADALFPSASISATLDGAQQSLRHLDLRVSNGYGVGGSCDLGSDWPQWHERGCERAQLDLWLAEPMMQSALLDRHDLQLVLAFNNNSGGAVARGLTATFAQLGLAEDDPHGGDSVKPTPPPVPDECRYVVTPGDLAIALIN
jgi:hypothetical protein